MNVLFVLVNSRLSSRFECAEYMAEYILTIRNVTFPLILSSEAMEILTGAVTILLLRSVQRRTQVQSVWF